MIVAKPLAAHTNWHHVDQNMIFTEQHRSKLLCPWCIYEFLHAFMTHIIGVPFFHQEFSGATDVVTARISRDFFVFVVLVVFVVVADVIVVIVHCCSLVDCCFVVHTLMLLAI
jgi:hypothetical protein